MINEDMHKANDAIDAPPASVGLVHSDVPQRAALVQTLERAGMRVHVYAQANEVLTALQTTMRLDLIIAELLLPGVDGATLCDLLDVKFCGLRPIPVILVHDLASTELVRALTPTIRADACLCLPMDEHRVVQAVQAAIGKTGVPRLPSALVISLDPAFGVGITNAALSEGFLATVVGPEEDLWRRASKEIPHVIILDADAASESRVDTLLSNFTRLYPQTATVIAATNHHLQSSIALANRGAAAFVNKAVEPRVLLRQCRDAATRWSLIRAGRMEAQRRHSNARYKAIYGSMIDGFALTDMAGRIVETNATYQRMVGYTDEELGQLTYLDLTPPRWHAMEEAIVQEQLLPLGFSEVYEKEYRRKDGTIFPIEVRTFLLRDPAGQANAMWAIIRDITERKESQALQQSLQQQLAQAQKMESIGRLAGGLAHDFNNLLTSIIGNTSLALIDLSPGDPQHTMLTEVYKAAESATVLTRQLLTFSRKQIIEPKRLDLNELIDHLQKMLIRLIGEDIHLATILDQELGVIRADPSQLEQAIVNLVVNARDAMPSGGRLTIQTKNVFLDEAYCARHADAKPGAHVLLVVSDTGTGMTEEEKSRAFEPFFTTKAKGKGTGLGLSIVFGTVKQHSGIIDIQSEPGKGSCFKIYFPRVDACAEVLPVGKADANLPGGKETILLVEDETIVRHLALKVLTRLGYNVLEASDGKDAHQKAREYRGHIDLLVTDVVMPGMNGRQVAESLQRIYPDLRVLFTSGYADNVVRRDGVLEQGAHFLEKPYSPQTLAKTVRDVLTLRQRPENG